MVSRKTLAQPVQITTFKGKNVWPIRQQRSKSIARMLQSQVLTVTGRITVAEFIDKSALKNCVFIMTIAHINCIDWKCITFARVSTVHCGIMCRRQLAQPNSCKSAKVLTSASRFQESMPYSRQKDFNSGSLKAPKRPHLIPLPLLGEGGAASAQGAGQPLRSLKSHAVIMQSQASSTQLPRTSLYKGPSSPSHRSPDMADFLTSKLEVWIGMNQEHFSSVHQCSNSIASQICHFSHHWICLGIAFSYDDHIASVASWLLQHLRCYLHQNHRPPWNTLCSTWHLSATVMSTICGRWRTQSLWGAWHPAPWKLTGK